MFLFLSRAFAEGESTVPANPSWFESAFKKFGEFPVWGWAVMAIFLILGVAFLAGMKGRNSKTTWNTQMISMGAISMALTTVLGLIRLFRLPMGGSITPAADLPLLIFSYVYGAPAGITVGFLYGVLRFILDGGQFAWAGLLPNLLDYPIGFGLLGLAGLFGQKSRENADEYKWLIIAIVVGNASRFFASFLSGWIFYGEYCVDYGFSSPVLYSICYNGAYMLPNCIICCVLGALVGPRLVRQLRSAARRNKTR